MSIAALRRVYLQQELEKKIVSWSNVEIRNNYVVNPRNPLFPHFGIERDENGFYYMSDRVHYYCDLRNGMIYRIKKDFREKDFLCYQELYNQGKVSGKFKIRQPLYREEIVLNNIKWEYVELASPNKEYGRSFNDHIILTWPKLTNGLIPDSPVSSDLKQSVADYFKEYFDDFIDLYVAVKQISEKNSCGIPGGICEISNRYKDTTGYFWSDFDHDDWNVGDSEIKIMSMDIFGSVLIFAKLCGVLDQTHVSELIDYARTKWTTI